MRQSVAAALVALAAFVCEHRGQEYTLNHGDSVLFWLADEQPVRSGVVLVLRGGYRVINSRIGVVDFRDVEWCYGNY
jgi:hypothetical protein